MKIYFLVKNEPNYKDLPSISNPSLTGYEYGKERILAESLSVEAKTKKLLLWDNKYAARDRVGDIIEVRSRDLGWKKEVGKFLKIEVDIVTPSIRSVKEQYERVSIAPTDPRPYYLDLTGLDRSGVGTIKMSLPEFTGRLRAK